MSANGGYPRSCETVKGKILNQIVCGKRRFIGEKNEKLDFNPPNVSGKGCIDTAISNAVLLDFINKATRAAIFKLSPGFHSAQHRDTRRETRERFISRQIIRQNSSSDLYLDGSSVWRMIRL